MTTAWETIQTYYDALRQGEPLYPFFAESDSVVKVGISERLTGYAAIAEGLREQTATTRDWTVDSHDLRVVDRDCHAWFGDDVTLAWLETATGTRHRFDSRWSGTLESRDGWVFVGMHVSAPHEL